MGSWGPLTPEQPRLCGAGFVGGEEGVSFLSLGHHGMTTPHIRINGNLQGTGRTSPPTVLLGARERVLNSLKSEEKINIIQSALYLSLYHQRHKI